MAKESQRPDQKEGADESSRLGEAAAGSPAARRIVSPFAIVLLALLLRAAALWLSQDAELVKDERAYVNRAIALLDGEGYVGSYQSWVRHTDSYKIAELPQYPGAYQPPGYTTFVAGALALSGRSPVAVKAAQVVVGTLCVLLVYWLGRAWFGARAGGLAGLIAALYPNLVGFTHLLWSETLFIAILLSWILLLTRRPELPGLWGCAGVGVLIGLSALTRSSIVYFLPVLVAWMLWLHRPRWIEGCARVACVLLVAAVVIAPWTLRNYAIHDGFVLIDTNSPYNLWRGNHPTSYSRRDEPLVPRYLWPFESIPIHPVSRQGASMLVNQAIMRSGNMKPTDLEVIAYASEVAWGYIQKEPLVFAQRVHYRLVDMWNPTSFVLRHLQLGSYGDVPAWADRALRVGVVGSYLLVLPLGALGLLLCWRNPRVWLAILLIAFFTAITMLAFGLTRFRLPLMPFFILGAGYVLDRGWAWREARRVPAG